jgi:hypothetical protein
MIAAIKRAEKRANAKLEFIPAGMGCTGSSPTQNRIHSKSLDDIPDEDLDTISNNSALSMGFFDPPI